MLPRRKSPAHAMKRVRDLGDETRNQCQKSVLLREVGKIRRNEVTAAVESSKRIVEESRKLCQHEDAETRKSV